MATAALAEGRPCLVLAGRVDIGRREYATAGVSGAMGITADLHDRGVSPDRAFADAAGALADLAERAARTWSR